MHLSVGAVEAGHRIDTVGDDVVAKSSIVVYSGWILSVDPARRFQQTLLLPGRQFGQHVFQHTEAVRVFEIVCGQTRFEEVHEIGFVARYTSVYPLHFFSERDSIEEQPEKVSPPRFCRSARSRNNTQWQIGETI